ncbi:acyl transferase/acyl hydrolase/lysophospholipase [Myxozyma melibiosi]|uniref:Acyl transferase/acyl hydrolase/lysophospholipase n=1 Tax=Myxozyma melibiosi TaxID=54550 RepID=A0ABR1EZN9_9ASCO
MNNLWRTYAFFVDFLFSLLSTVAEVAMFWHTRMWSVILGSRPESRILQQMGECETYEEWMDLAFELDSVLGNDLWRANPKSDLYDYKLISERLDMIMEMKEMGDVISLTNNIRSGLVRNLGNIANKKLFTYTGTKFLIEKYNLEVIDSFNFLLEHPLSTLSVQAKLDLVHDTRQSYGLSTLVLQGGVLFGLCHLGVVRALHEHQLLPRIITGVGVGALIASLVCIHRDDELPEFLDGNGINLSAFGSQDPEVQSKDAWTRIKRFVTKGYLLDIQVLQQVVRDNTGDLTFEEAYARTRRVLNISVHSDDKYVPNLFNYLTTPNVLIWSAACASNALPGLFEEILLMCKNEHGQIVPWMPTGSTIKWKSWTATPRAEREAPYTRVSELFNVNHFIVSQARPYIAPFIMQDFHQGESSWRIKLLRLVAFEIRHRLSLLETLGLLPDFLHKLFLSDDRRLMNSEIITIAPNLTISDFWRFFVDAPHSREDIRYWSKKGEQSAWFVLPLIRQRCGVEFMLDSVYDVMFRSRNARKL